ncbi:MAG: hypothetical protein IJM20_02035 [Clostridia bacterium]|nr:hypothetical protein [Clostridia bacterium]
MKLKNTVLLVMIAVMEAALGFGVMSIYSMYFKLPIDGCTSISVDSHNYFIGEEAQMDEAYAELMDRLGSFADEDGSLMIAVPLGAAGIAVRDNTGWLKTVLKSGDPADFEAGRGVIVSSDPIARTYIDEGVFMRGTLDLRIVGVYDEAKMPLQLRNMGFICPPGMANRRAGLTEVSGLIVLSSSKRTEELIALIGESGWREKNDAEVISRPIGLIEGIKNCFTHEDPFSVDMRPTAYGVLALIMGIVYSGLILCRDNLRPLSVRRLFGMPLSRMIGLYALTALLTAAAGLLLFFGTASAVKVFWFFEPRHTVRLFTALAAILVLAALTVCSCGAFMLRKRFRGGDAR